MPWTRAEQSCAADSVQLCDLFVKRHFGHEGACVRNRLRMGQMSLLSRSGSNHDAAKHDREG